MFNSNIPFYSLFIFLALLSNVVVVSILSKKYNYSYKEIVCLLLYENVGIIGGAKVMSFLTSYKGVKEFNFISLGLSSYGAVLGALAFIILFCVQFKISIKNTLLTFLPSFPLMYSIGKIGCFLSGCCYGIKYNGIFKIMYKYSSEAINNIYLFPIQIVESLVFLIIFILIMITYKKNKFNIKTLSIFIIICGFSKFVLDFFRMSHLSFISFNQIASIIFILSGIVLFIYSNLKINKNFD